MAKRFYNPGNAINEMLRFDHPTNDPKDLNNVAYYRLEVGPRSFFEVPTHTEVETVNGIQEVAVGFWKRIKEDYRSYGVILIEPKAKDVQDEDNVAASDKEAKERGDARFKEHLVSLAREHVARCEEARAYGGVPRRAIGNTAHALKVLNIADPADQVGTAVESSKKTAEISTLEEKIARLERLLEGKAK